MQGDVEDSNQFKGTSRQRKRSAKRKKLRRKKHAADECRSSYQFSDDEFHFSDDDEDPEWMASTNMDFSDNSDLVDGVVLDLKDSDDLSYAGSDKEEAVNGSDFNSDNEETETQQ